MALERGEPIVVSDVRNDERFDAGDGGRYDSPSFAVAPVGRAGEAIGVLCATDRAGGGSFDSDDLGLLRLLATQVAQILERRPAAANEASSHSDLEPFDPSEFDTPAEGLVAAGEAPPNISDDDADSQVEFGEASAAVPDRDAELARRICEAITEEVAPDRIFAAALRPLAEGLGAAPVSIFLIDAEHGVLRCESSYDAGSRDDRETLPTVGGLTGSVLQTGRMVATDTPEADGRFSPEIDTPADGRVGPMLCVPLTLRGKVVGLFRAFPEHGRSGGGRVVGERSAAAARIGTQRRVHRPRALGGGAQRAPVPFAARIDR